MVADVIPEIVLVVGSVVVLLYALAAPRRLQAGAALLALATAALATVATLAMLGGPEYLTFADTYARDGTAVWGKLIVLAGTVGAIGLSVPWFESDHRHGEYYALLLLSALGAVFLAGATDLKQFVMAMMLSSATGFVLAAYHRRSSPASEAAIKYYLVGAFTSASMLIGVAYLFGLAGSTTLSGLTRGLPTGGLALATGAALVILAVTFKIGALPAHAWVPDVAQGAPAPVAAFVTSIPKVGGLIFLARLVLALPTESVEWRPLVAVLAAATMTLGNLAALWQNDVRRLLGWSAVSQIGYGLMAVVALERSALAVPSLLFFLLAYVVGNVAAFGVVVELRGRTALGEFTGLARARAWLAGALAVSFLSFIGVPPLVGFVAKLLLFGATIEAGYTWLAALAVVNTVVSIFYYARVLGPVYFGPLAGPVPVLGRWAAVATLACAAALVLVGIVAEPFYLAFTRAGLLGG
ncbi:MAG: NADH-quinone oxidoreductase subunit N [Chloroflexi bacterium]|nr:NADH-quinone oxidoreductase subunit N [Chloroflexota bacterium]